jgi:hypothetical protein
VRFISPPVAPSPVALEHVDELLGLDDRAAEVGLVLQRHGQHGLLDPLAERIGVVGEVVQDADARAEVEDGDAGARRQRFEVAGRRGADAHVLQRRRVELVQHEGRDVARRPRTEVRAIAEHAGRQRENGRLDGRFAVVLEERDGPGLAVVLNGEVLRPQIGDRLAFLVERGHGQLPQPRRGPKGRRLILCRQGEDGHEGDQCLHTADSTIRACKVASLYPRASLPAATHNPSRQSEKPRQHVQRPCTRPTPAATGGNSCSGISRTGPRASSLSAPKRPTQPKPSSSRSTRRMELGSNRVRSFQEICSHRRKSLDRIFGAHRKCLHLSEHAAYGRIAAARAARKWPVIRDLMRHSVPNGSPAEIRSRADGAAGGPEEEEAGTH